MHMERDSNHSHSLIERKKKKYNGNIEHPHDSAQLIRQTERKKQFIVKEMVRENFSDFGGLLTGQLQLRKMNTNGNAFNWRHIKWLYFDKKKSLAFFITRQNWMKVISKQIHKKRKK
ncbi:hypothetical protein PR048_022700 [Dryococelus australis]|uniref:Uncharacterized protein n=1 Tax=Dryococelus australis TaxID=614101 RepID=A0ABQ9GS02_9NEOP|nr:hypothetical protein PR048_022700 [Dryococelus australis]